MADPGGAEHRIDQLLSGLGFVHVQAPSAPPLSPRTAVCRSGAGAIFAYVRATDQTGRDPVGYGARFDATTRACVISSFQQCLPDEIEQEVLREAFLDVEGAKRWAVG